MAESPGTLDGWYALHDFRSLDWGRWNKVPVDRKSEILKELADLMNQFEGAEQGHSAAFSVIGHKADFLILHLRPTLREVGELETQFNATQFADYCKPAYSYVSITELSLYEATVRGGTEDIEALMTQPLTDQKMPDSYEYMQFDYLKKTK